MNNTALPAVPLWRVRLAPCFMVAFLAGCGPNYAEMRLDGQRAMLRGDYSPARYFLEQADQKKTNRVENLHDLGLCSVMLAQARSLEGNRTAALRELDRAIAYYSRAIDAHPGHHASMIGKNVALELKGLRDRALENARWAARIVGPAAKQHMFLAAELEERGDMDGALLRYLQAIAMEPRNAAAHVAMAKFLMRHGKESDAVYHLQIAYRLNPRDPWVSDQLITRGQVPPITPPPQTEP